MSRHIALAWLAAACALLAVAFLFLIGPTGTSRAEPMIEKVVVDPVTLTVSEPSGSGTFTLTLTSQPVAPVSVSLVANNNQCSVLPNSIIVDADNWDTGAPATVTAVDDMIADASQTCPIITGKSVSTDPNYDGLNVRDVRVTVLDNDVPGITVDPTSLTVAEPAGYDVFALTLTSQPIAAVSVPFLITSSQCTVLPSSATLDAINWATGVTATVTAVDDQSPDGTQTCLVQTVPASSTDSNYTGRDASDVTVIVLDSNLPAVAVNPTSLTVTEGGSPGTLTIRLTTQPAYLVSVPLSAIGGECTVSPGSVTLDATNWATGAPATVAAVDDLEPDGPQICTIRTGPTSSTDTNYAGLYGPNVTVTVNDNDMVGVTVNPTSLTVTEGGSPGTFTIRLTSQPAAPVSVALSTSNNQCTVSPGSVTLDATNWATGAPVTVTAVDDLEPDGPQPCLILTGPTSSADPDYRGLPVKDVQVTVLDNETPGIAISPPSLTIAEPDGSAIFTLTLTTQPTASVLVFLSSTAPDECTVLPDRVRLNTIDWSTGVTATVKAVDDHIRDGTQTCPVQVGPTSSTDPHYDGLKIQTMNVTVLDIPTLSVYLALILSHWPPVPDIPTLQPIANTDGDGNYTIVWTSTLRAELYVLEESTSGTMSGAREIYSGTSTSHSVGGRGAARYYYRVKARNASGDSGWSVVQAVDVLWEAEPNDEPYTQANGPIVSGLTYYGTFPSGADPKDYFYFDLSTAHSIELWLTDIPAGQNYDLILRNSTLTAVGYSANEGNAPEHILTATLPIGRYYVQVYNNFSGGGTQPYHLKTVYQ